MNAFDIMTLIDRDPMGFYANMDDETREYFDKNSGWLIPQYYTTASSASMHEGMLVMFDMACNPYWKALEGHPELRGKLLGALNQGRTKRRLYRPSGALQAFSLLKEFLMVVYEDIKDQEVTMFRSITSDEDFLQLVKDHGISDKEQEALIKAWNKIA